MRGFGSGSDGVEKSDLWFGASDVGGGNVGKKDGVFNCVNAGFEIESFHGGIPKTPSLKLEMGLRKKLDLSRGEKDATASNLSGFAPPSLVWGKIRGHPWWPGQIFDPADASKTALKHYKKGKVLVAYFGDGSFAWSDVSCLKPFQLHFPEMVNQSRRAEAFCKAVSSALDEVFKRVEYGLACACLPDDVYADIQSQTVDNWGICKKSRKRNIADECSSMKCFEPSRLVSCLKEVAKSSEGFHNRLEQVISKAQSTAFCHWKGYRELPEFCQLGGSLEGHAQDTCVHGQKSQIDEGEDMHHVQSSKTGQDKDKELQLHKRKQGPNCSMTPRQTKKKISDSFDKELRPTLDHTKLLRKLKVSLEDAAEESISDPYIKKVKSKDNDKSPATDVAFISPVVGGPPDCPSSDCLLTQPCSTHLHPVTDHISQSQVPLIQFFSHYPHMSSLNFPISQEMQFFVEASSQKCDGMLPEYTREPIHQHVEESYWADQFVDKDILDTRDELERILLEHSTRVVLPKAESESDPPLRALSNMKEQDQSRNLECAKKMPGKQISKIFMEKAHG